MFHNRFYLFALVMAFVIAGSFEAGADRVVLVKNGEAQFGLALPGQPEPNEQLAAEELNHFVQEMSGATFSRVDFGTKGPVIYLGRAGSFPEARIPSGIMQAAQDLGPEEYLTQGVGDDLYLIGGSARGVLWAVYGILKELGCRWYMPGKIGEVAPRCKTLVIEGDRRIEGPDFFDRDIWYSWGGAPDGGPRFAEWKRRNRLYRQPVNHGHNLTASMPPSASFKKRPELYSLVNGKRTSDQVCTSNPEVIDLISQTVNAYFDKYPDVLCYSLCPDDNDNFCECEHCRALDAGGFDADRNKPIVTDRYVTFLNQVAERVQKQHPGKMVSMYAYINYSTPPVRTKISPYVVVFFTSSVYCGGHGIGDSICASRMKMKSDLSAWARACSNVYIYEYDPMPGNLEVPWPLFGARVREMPLYRKMGIKGMSVEGHCSWATVTPNHWVTAQCLWNADQTVDALLRDFCNGFFHLPNQNGWTGPTASEAMLTYYKTLEHTMAQYKPKIEWGSLDIPKIYTPNVMRACRTALDQAFRFALASSSPGAGRVVRRLQMVDMGFAYLERYLYFLRLDAKGAELESLERAFTDCTALVNRMYKTNSDFVEMHSALPGLKKAYGKMMEKRPPKEFRMVTTWNAIGPFSNDGAKGHDTVYPPEQNIDLNATYPGVDGPVRWKVIRAGKGKAYINLIDHFSPKDWVTVYALNYLYAKRDMDVQLRMGSNDTLKVWLNGELVWHFDQGRSAVIDEDVVPVHLKTGWNSVLLKVSQTGLEWGFYFRVTDTKGRPARDVRCALTPK